MTKQEIYIEKLFAKYDAELFKYVDQIFYSKIKPYLDKYHLEFLSGNGAYYIGWTEQTPKWFIRKYRCLGINEKNAMIDSDKITKRIRNILDSNVSGYRTINLGCIMPNYEQ